MGYTMLRYLSAASTFLTDGLVMKPRVQVWARMSTDRPWPMKERLLPLATSVAHQFACQIAMGFICVILGKGRMGARMDTPYPKYI